MFNGGKIVLYLATAVLLLLIHFANVAVEGESNAQSDSGNLLNHRFIRSPENRKEQSKKVIPEEDYDEDEEEGELEDFEYDSKNEKGVNAPGPPSNNQKSFDPDVEAELGPQTIEDLEELELFYGNTKNNIMRTHRSRILETRNGNSIQDRKDGKELSTGKKN